MRLVLVTGLSGAGKSHALRIMEDLGFFCVDNLPPLLIGTLVGLCRKQDMEKVAIGADIRGGRFFGDIYKALYDLKDYGVDYEVLFLDATDETLVKRYKESRRAHPLATSIGSLAEAIASERDQLYRLRDNANFVIDTSQLLPKQLRERITDLFTDGASAGFHITFVTFGYKRGIPAEADMVYDMRFIPNPFYVDRLKEKTGRDQEVKDYVMAFEGTQTFIDSITEQLLFLIPLYKQEAKNELVVAIGCTGGQHRSVVLAEVLQTKMLKAGYRATVSHRDMDRDRETR
jgi:RNase adapter protein RapZ